MSVTEVMQSEKKLRIKGLLKLHASGGDISVKTFLDKVSDIKLERRDTSFIDTFPMCDIALEKPEDLPALLMVTHRTSCLTPSSAHTIFLMSAYHSMRNPF